MLVCDKQLRLPAAIVVVYHKISLFTQYIPPAERFQNAPQTLMGPKIPLHPCVAAVAARRAAAIPSSGGAKPLRSTTWSSRLYNPDPDVYKSVIE